MITISHLPDPFFMSRKGNMGTGKLRQAVASGDKDALVRQLSKKGADAKALIEGVDEVGQTAIHEAAASDQGDIIEVLAENGGEINRTDR